MLFLYGVKLIVGGVMGFMKKNSMPSLIAGGACGALALISFGISFDRPKTGFFGGFVVACAVAAIMYGRYFETNVMMPTGAVAVRSTFVVLFLLIGMMGSDKK